MNLFESLMNENHKVSKKRVKESTDDSMRVRQLRHNIEGLVDEYYNSIQDGVWEPFSTTDDMVDWVYSQVFDIKDSGNGFTRYGKGICDDLKYLGKDFIVNEIIELGQDLLADDVVTDSGKVTESAKRSDIELVMKAAADVQSDEDLRKVISSLKLIDYESWKEYSEMQKSGEYSPAAIGSMISDDLYFQLDEKQNDLIVDESKSCKGVTEANEPYFGSSKYEYDEDSEDDRITYDVISEHLSAMFDDIGVDPQYVGQLSRFERVMSDLIYLYKAYKDED